MLLGSFVDGPNLANFPGQQAEIGNVARHNRGEIERALQRHEIDCDWEATGEVLAATKHWQVDVLRDIHRASVEAGSPATFWEADAIRAELDSPMFLAGVFEPEASVMVHPGKLAWGLKRACENLGVRIFEHTPATGLERVGQHVGVSTPYGGVSAEHVALATYAHPSLVKSTRWWRIPLYSHVLMTEPLSAEQMDSIGWRGRQGFVDLDAFYYYYRLTADNRILWGVVDATLHRNRGMSPEFDQDLPLFARMASDFVARFPQLRGVGFTHRWGGVLDNTSRSAPFFGTACSGRVAYAHGYTGGVGASRGGAAVMLDLLAGRKSQYTQLPLVSGRGIHGRPSLRPYPPEPLLSLGMNLARRAIAKEEATGDRHWFARLLNRAGYNF
jgi:glycine/D-amino acid oxidase-like deaminating enzyme